MGGGRGSGDSGGGGGRGRVGKRTMGGLMMVVGFGLRMNNGNRRINAAAMAQ